MIALVPPPTAAEEVRTQVIERLEEALKQARAGGVDEILIIMRHPGDDEWSNLSTDTLSLSRWIGYLEQTKIDWVDLARANRHCA